MNPSNKLLSDIVAYRTYAKYLPHLARRESLEETINRNLLMHLDRFPKLSRDIIKAYQLVHELKVMPSMRALQFSGEAILKNNLRQYNCSFVSITYPRAFSEALFLLLSGCGVGYSVQKHHISELPAIKKPIESNKAFVHDSIAGWADALDLLMDSYFYGSIKPLFDFSQVRPKGSYLVTTGAKAPGPEPLKYMLDEVEKRLKASLNRKLTPIEIHDLICIISDCVLAGGIRRSSLISLFDRTDTEMLEAKSGEWWIKHPYRARANNSAVLPRSEVTHEEFNYLFEKCKDSNAGEPGFSWTNNVDVGTNPCHEISLNSNQLCNLTTINQTGIKNKKDFLNRIYSATLLGTLQAAYTDFPYVGSNWKVTTEREALLGVSFTGIADTMKSLPVSWIKEGAKLAKQVNEKYARKLGINLAARIGCIKPEGTASCVLGSSSGIHSRHSQYYLRRVRMNSNDSLAVYLKHTVPSLIEEDQFSANGVVLTIPQESPENSIARDYESAEDLFNRVCFYNKNWINPTHRQGDNTHNVSCTVSVKSGEWESLKQTMWNNRASYTGISLLPFDGGNYVQAPFESCDKVKYEELLAQVKEIDLKQVKEEEDNTNRISTVACAGGICEIEI